MEIVLEYFKEDITQYWCANSWEYLCDIWPILIDSGLLRWGWAVLVVIASAVWKGSQWAWNIYKNRKIAKILRPYYSYNEVKAATRYFVPTKGQERPPSDFDEPGKLKPREELISMFINEVFVPSGDDKKYYVILGGSGMGKTTFMINLLIKYRLRWRLFQFKKAPIQLFPLSDTRTLGKVKEIEDKANTILLLDALDEDPEASKDLDNRLTQIVEATQDFRTILITCRTQFFPSVDAEPHVTKVKKYGGSGGFQTFEKIYVAPFGPKDIKTYLRKRFSLLRIRKRFQGAKIVSNTPKIMVRPMILANINELIQKDYSYQQTHEIYAGIIDSWLEREGKKFVHQPEKRKEFIQNLRAFSHGLAMDLYSQHKAGLGIRMEEETFKSLAQKYEIDLSELEIKSRSLLNRSAIGEWKFSHKSIMEYFVALHFQNFPDQYLIAEFTGLDMAAQFSKELTGLERIEMIRVDGGKFMMGGNQYGFEQPIHEVSVPSFEISKYPITQAQWEAIMGNNPSHFNFNNCPNCPVERVSWDDAQAFLKKLNTLWRGNFRLPTEAEWEFAARGGTKSSGYTYSGSNRAGTVGWYSGNAKEKTHAVGQKSPNELGLYDVSGNVWEWCQDRWHKDYKHAPSDGSTWESGESTDRVIRGGSWNLDALGLRVSYRYYGNPDVRYNFIGFRLTRTP